MKKFFVAWLISVCLVAGAQAGRMSLLGAGTVTAAGSTYSGPGDQAVTGGFTFWGSCARVFSNAKASTSTSMCDLVAVGNGAVVCTLRGTTSGFVDLAASYCAGTTPSAACAAANGGACRVTKVYDQTGNGNDMTNATLANMPDLAFGSLNSLPAFSCVGRSAGSCTVATTTTFNSFTPPQNYWMVYKSANTGADTGIVGIDSAAIALGIAVAADNARVFNVNLGNSEGAVATAYHSAAGLMSTAASGTYTISVDSIGDSSITGVGVANFPASTHLRCHRADGGATQDVAILMECGILVDQSNSWSSTDRTNLNNNAHNATNGYNF